MARLTVLGIGNVLMRDEGVGVRLMEAVQRVQPWPADVEFVDGGAGGLNLLLVIERAAKMIVFDAADMKLPAGEFRVIQPGQLAQDDAGGRISLHDIPFVETLKLCEQFSRRPDEIVILAIQPGVVDYGLALSEELQAAMPRLTAAATELVTSAVSDVPHA